MQLLKNDLLPVCHRWLVIIISCCRHAIHVTQSTVNTFTGRTEIWDIKDKMNLGKKLHRRMSLLIHVQLFSDFRKSLWMSRHLLPSVYDLACPYYNNSHGVVSVSVCCCTNQQSHSWPAYPLSSVSSGMSAF